MTNTVDEELDKTIAFLQKFDASKVPDEKLKKLVFLIGMSGTGKSTLTSYLAGEKNLKIVNDNGKFKIRGPRIGEKRMVSETIYPDVVKIENDATKDYYLVDCPGFADSRNATHDISTTVFIKSLLERAEQVKFAIVMVHDDIRGVTERTHLKTLVNRLNDFFNPAKDLEDNFAVILNRVPHKELKIHITNSLHEDFKEHRPDFINIITKNNSEKIHFFHEANANGSMWDFQFFKDDVKLIFDTFETKLKYFNPKSRKFGFPIHADTQIHLNKLYGRLYEDVKWVIHNNIPKRLDDELKNDGDDKNNFYKLVSTIGGLNWQEEPRSNLLAQLENYDSKVAEDLRVREKSFTAMKQLPPYDQEQEYNKYVRDYVQVFKESFENKLKMQADKMYDSVTKKLDKCMDDFKTSLEITAELPPNYKEMEEFLYHKIAQLTIMKNSFKNKQQATLPLLQLLDSAKYKVSNMCNSWGESLDKVQRTSYVSEEKTLEVIRNVQTFLITVEEKYLEWIAQKLWTKFEAKVNAQVTAINVFLCEKYQDEVRELDHPQRKKELEKYINDIDKLFTTSSTFDKFHQDMTDFGKKNFNLTDLYDDFKRLKNKQNPQISKFIYETRDWGQNLREVRDYVRNSAPAQHSFINAAAKWVKSQIHPLLPGASGGSQDASYRSYGVGDVNPTLMLMDLVVRQFVGTKRRRAGLPVAPAMDDLEVQAHTLNIIDECEAKHIHECQLDFVGLQTELHKRLSRLDDEENVDEIRDELLEMTDGPQSA